MGQGEQRAETAVRARRPSWPSIPVLSDDEDSSDDDERGDSGGEESDDVSAPSSSSTVAADSATIDKSKVHFKVVSPFRPDIEKSGFGHELNLTGDGEREVLVAYDRGWFYNFYELDGTYVSRPLNEMSDEMQKVLKSVSVFLINDVVSPTEYQFSVRITV